MQNGAIWWHFFCRPLFLNSRTFPGISSKLQNSMTFPDLEFFISNSRTFSGFHFQDLWEPWQWDCSPVSFTHMHIPPSLGLERSTAGSPLGSHMRTPTLLLLLSFRVKELNLNLKMRTTCSPTRFTRAHPHPPPFTFSFRVNLKLTNEDYR